MKTTFQTLLLGAGFGAAFLLGQLFPPKAAADARGAIGNGGQLLEAQGRGPVNVPVAPGPQPPDEAAPAEPIVFTDGAGGVSAANGFLAVTGSYGIGTSVLYLIDTQSRQLAVYEARGGSAAQRRVVLVGARRIDLDLQLPGYNDRSEYEYDDLQRLFEKRGSKAATVTTGLESGK